jgi:hypothetical protein
MRVETSAADLKTLVARIEDGKDSDRVALIAQFLEIDRSEGGSYEIVKTCLKLVQEKKLGPEDLAPHLPLILEFWNLAFAEVPQLQQSGPDVDWMYDDAYRWPRSYAGVLLDLLGYLPKVTAVPHLRTTLSLSDPWLKMWAVTSLLRHSEPVQPDHIEQIASSNEARIILWQNLRKLGLTRLMPPNWAATEALAASALTVWAAHPSELGTPPEQIELMDVFPVEVEGDMLAVYLFRFREYPKPWVPGEGWKAGIAGPFRDGQELMSPWSSFETWDSMSPQDHFEKLYRRPGACRLS